MFLNRYIMLFTILFHMCIYHLICNLNLNFQLYIWIGYNSAKFGHLYVSVPTPFVSSQVHANL